MKRAVWLLLAVLTAGSAVAGGCSSPSTKMDATPGSGTTDEEIEDVIYRADTTDEGLVTLLDAPPVASASSEPVIIAPADESVLTAGVTFTVQVGPTAERGAEPAPRARSRSFARSLEELFTLEREAFAHGALMNGDAYFWVFATAEDSRLLRVFSQETSYVPTAEEWQRLVDAREVVTLTVTRAIFEQGKLTSDGGPFVGKPSHFTVAE